MNAILFIIPLILFGVIEILDADARGRGGPAENLRITNLDGNSLDMIYLDQQILITRDSFSNSHYSGCLNPTVKGLELVCDNHSTYKFTKDKSLVIGHKQELSFVHIVQIQNSDGETVYLTWIEGNLLPYQAIQSQISWIPHEYGKYTATSFIWESINNPTALAPPISTTITVGNAYHP